MNMDAGNHSNVAPLTGASGNITAITHDLKTLDIWAADDQGKIYKWTNSENSTLLEEVYDLGALSGKTLSLTSICVARGDNDNVTIYAAAPHAVYYSIDGGSNFSEVTRFESVWPEIIISADLHADAANNVFGVFNSGPGSIVFGYSIEIASKENPGIFSEVSGINGEDFPATMQLGRSIAALNLQNQVNVYSIALMTVDRPTFPIECLIEKEFHTNVPIGRIGQVALSRSTDGNDDKIYAIYNGRVVNPHAPRDERIGYLMKVEPASNPSEYGTVKPLWTQPSDGKPGYVTIPNAYPHVLFVKSGKAFVGQPKTNNLYQIDLATRRIQYTYANALPDPLTSPSYFNDQSAFHAAYAYFGTRGGIYRIEV